jgi:hypothetical protein
MVTIHTIMEDLRVKKTTVYLDEDVLANVKLIAKREHRSEAEVIRESVALFVAGKVKQMPSFIGTVSDSEFAAADDEAYLVQHWKPE